MVIMLVCAYQLGTTQTETITATEVKEVEKAVEIIPDGYIDTDSEEFYDNFVDMQQVIDFTATESGLMIYLNDGSSYYWE